MACAPELFTSIVVPLLFPSIYVLYMQQQRASTYPATVDEPASTTEKERERDEGRLGTAPLITSCRAIKHPYLSGGRNSTIYYIIRVKERVRINNLTLLNRHTLYILYVRRV